MRKDSPLLTRDEKLYIYLYVINGNISTKTLVCIQNASGLSSLALPPLVCLSLGAGVLEILDKRLKISERIEEYKLIYKFYRQLLHLYKADKINEKEINLREEEFVSNFNYFPREKYLEKVRLNGN
jgi:hypothetical protein